MDRANRRVKAVAHVEPGGAIMDPTQERQLNQAAYRQLRSVIDRTFLHGRFVAISEGKIIADAARFEELNSLFEQMGNHSPEVLVVRAGGDYPEMVTIF
jgi:hypothetical protein